MPRRKRLGYTVTHPGVARVQFILSERLASEVAALAEAEGKTVSWKVAEFVREALAEYDAGTRMLVPAVDGVRHRQPDTRTLA